MAFPTGRSSSSRNRSRSPLKIQTASCLLSAAAVLGIAIMPFPILGATASPLGTPTLAVTPTASPATSPVMAYFGEDVHVQSAERGEWACQPESSGAKDLEKIEDYSSSASSSMPFLLQVDAPKDGMASWSFPTATPPRRKVKRLASSTEVFPEASDSVHSIAAVSFTELNAGFTVNENIASTYSPSSAIASSSSSSSSNSQSTATVSSAQIPIPTAPTSRLPLATPFPQPFDQSLSYSLSTSCVAFLASYLGSEKMIGNSTRPNRIGSCGRPFGLLMSSSSGWAKITRNETLLNAAISQICYATGTEDCSQYYESLAVDIQRNANCGADIKSKKAVAIEALYGFQNYDMLQTAACLKDSQTDAYCYVSAMSTLSPPDDGYLYSLPSGISLPSTTKPTCSSCSAKLINLYTQTISNASDTTQGAQYSVASVLQPALIDATALVRQTCGSTFAGQSTAMQAHVSNDSLRPSFSLWAAWGTPLAVVLLLAFSSLAV